MRRRELRERAVALSDVCPYRRELFPNGDHLLALDNPQLFALRLPGIYLCLINFSSVYIYLFSTYGQQTHLEEGNVSFLPCLSTALTALCFCRARPHLIDSSGDLFQVLPLIVSCP